MTGTRLACIRVGLGLDLNWLDRIFRWEWREDWTGLGFLKFDP